MTFNFFSAVGLLIPFPPLVLLLFVLLSSLAIGAEEEEECTLPYIERSSPNLVHNCVCTVTGAYVDVASDLVIPGPVPLRLERHYNSKVQGGIIGKGWGFSHFDGLKTYGNVKRHSHSGIRQGGILFGVLSNSSLDYEKKKSQYALLTLDGHTNISHGFPSARTNIKNQLIELNENKDKIFLTAPNGNVRTFNLHKKHSSKEGEDELDLWLETSHRDNNGNGWVYNMGQEPFFISEIRSKHFDTNREFGFVTLTPKWKNKQLSIKSSIGQTVRYHFEKGTEDEPLLTWVQRSFGPDEHYSYADGRLTKKTFSDGSFLEIDYYSNHEHSRLKNKVRALYAPEGTTGEPVKIFSFHYEKNSTLVKDSHGELTTYRFTKEGRICSITSAIDYIPYRTEELFWGSDKKNESNLTGKVVKDLFGNVVQGLYFEYDSSGNVRKKTLYGKLTGGTCYPHKLPYLRQAVICEKETTSYTYTSNNMLKTETHEDGVSIHYQYDDLRPHLATARLTLFNEEIKKREFFHYDAMGTKIYQSEDDGSSKNETDLTGVTEKRITRITLRSIAPLNFPERIEEYALDMCTGQEILLKTIEQDYSPEGLLLKSATYASDGTLGGSHFYSYDDWGRCISETDPLGQVTRFLYENNNRSVTKKLTDECTIHNTYDKANRLISQTETIPNGSCLTTRWTYDSRGLCKSKTDPYGQTTRYHYDTLGRLIETIFPAVENEQGERLHPRTSVEYDITDNPIVSIDEMGQKTTREFNIRGQVTSITTPDGRKETYLYDKRGQLIAKREKNKCKRVYTRDYQGRVLTETLLCAKGEILSQVEHRYNAFHLLSTTDSGGTTYYSYDCAGQLSQKKRGDAVTTYLYDAMGRVGQVIEEVDSNCNRYTFHLYDALDRQIEERIESQEGEVLHYDRFEYDSFGNKSLSQIGESITISRYNGFNQLVETSDKEGHATHITYNTEHYNSLGQSVLQTTTTDPLGFQRVDTYDAAHRVVASTRKNPFGKEVERTETVYDILGRVSAVKNYIFEEGKEPLAVIHRYFYTPSNQIEREEMASNTEDKRITRYCYNAMGQKIEKIKPDDVSLLFSYDAKGRLKALSSSDNSIAYLYRYNESDQVIETLDELTGKTTTLTYDQNGRVLSEKLANDLTIAYSYDSGGRTRKITLPDASSIDYTYDCLNLKAIHRNKNGKRLYSHYEHEQNLTGQTLAYELANGQRVKRTYDSVGRSVAIESPLFSQVVPERGYDPVGHLREVVTQGEPLSFGYDDHDNLALEKGFSYSYDALGNREIKNGERARYNRLNQLASRGKLSYDYDLSGNLTCKRGSEEEVLYGYDALDRLISVTESGKKTTYCYDSNNRRISQTLPSGKEQLFLYIGQEEAGLVENNVLVQLKVLGKGKRHLSVAVEMGKEVYVPLHDLFGNCVSLTTLTADSIQSFRYSAFGEMTITEGPAHPLTPWLYANKRLDKSGLYSFGLRFYDPESGRWLTQDPAGERDGQNLYAYVHNSPLLYFDEQGAFSIWEGLTGLASGLYNGFTTAAEYTYTAAAYAFQNIGVAANGARDPLLIAGLGIFDFAGPQVFETNQLMNPATGKHYNYPEDPGRSRVVATGICNTYRDAANAALYISKITGFNATVVCAPTKGFIADLFIAMSELFGYKSAGTRALDKTLREKISLGNDVLLYAHSRGCITARNVLMNLSDTMRQNIDYMAIAPAAYTEDRYCRGIKHLRSDRDIVPYVDLYGLFRCQETTHDIKCHPDAPLYDHGLTSPTFTDWIERWDEQCRIKSIERRGQ